MAASMVITTSTNIMIKPPVPNDCASPIAADKADGAQPLREHTRATSSITTLAKASAMPR